MAVVVDQGQGFKPFSRPPRCKLLSFTQLDYQALDLCQSDGAQSLEHSFDQFSNIHKSFSTPCLLSLSSHAKDDHGTNSRIEIIAGRAKPRIRALAAEVTMAMASGVNPEPVSKGLGGAYLLRSNNGDTIAVAKPIDEEPLAFNNPKGLTDRTLGQPGMKCSIKIGETGPRESAAYFLDHDGFAGVPPTALVRFSSVQFSCNDLGGESMPTHNKIASLQRFVNHEFDAGDMGPSSFSVTCVHRVGILDVRLMNLDRHAGNILVKPRNDGRYARGMAELVPIDHGFCLPESLDDPYFEWLHWPQASLPFSETDTNYISRLDPHKDAEIIRMELPSIRESSIRVLVLCTIFLKRAVAHGLCLADIGAMMSREIRGGKENSSTLEKLCIKAKASLTNNNNNQRNEQVDDVDQVLDIPSGFQNLNTKGKASKIPRMCAMTGKDDSASSKKEHYLLNGHGLNTKEENCEIGRESKDGNPKVGTLTKSQSFPAPNRESQCIVISFGEMNDEEWQLFLERFEMVLPEAFEERKFVGLSRLHASRSSCLF